MLHIRCLFAFSVIALAPFGISAQEPLWQTLLEKGLPVSDKVTVKASPTVMADDLSAAEQLKVLDQVRGRSELHNFVTDRDGGPFTMELDATEYPDEKFRVHRLDLYFTTPGRLDTLADEKSLDDLLGDRKGAKEKQHTFSADELKTRGIMPFPGEKFTPAITERYSWAEEDILERVRLAFVGHAMSQKGAKSIRAASVLDTRFAKDADYPNRATLVNRKTNEVEAVLPYHGVATHLKITPLLQLDIPDGKVPPKALFVELHLLFYEPYEWFDGRNVLRSKFSTALREKVELLRRTLIKAERAAK